MIHFIYPIKDTWISSGSNKATIGISETDQNYGQDLILDLKKVYNNSSFDYNTRLLIQFDLNESVNSISKSIAIGNIKNPKFYLRVYEANGTQELSTEYTLHSQALSQSWDEGTGKFGDNPKVTNGVSWENRQNPAGASAVTWSNADGTPSHGGAVYVESSSAQSFSYESPDVNMDVTDMVNSWISGSADGGLPNNGLLLRFSGSHENATNADGSYVTGNLKFFSRNTNTIYSPRLEVAWNSQLGKSVCKGANTGSMSKSTISGSEDYYIYPIGLKESYKSSERVKFRFGIRDRYIQKTFSNSVQTVTGSYIPDTSGSYSIVDIATGESIIPFKKIDSNTAESYNLQYTYLSCDPTSMYFDQWLDGFYPDRVYKVLIKVKYDDGQEVIYDEGFEFKVKS